MYILTEKIAIYDIHNGSCSHDFEISQITQALEQIYNSDIILIQKNLQDIRLLNEKNDEIYCVIWGKVFKNGPSKVSRRQPLKNLKC